MSAVAAMVLIGCGDDATQPTITTSGAGGTSSTTATSSTATTSSTTTTTSTGSGPAECATGTWDDDGAPNTPCVLWTSCTAGQHVDQPGSPTSDQTCTACESGTFTLATNAASYDPLTFCEPGEQIG